MLPIMRMVYRAAFSSLFMASVSYGADASEADRNWSAFLGGGHASSSDGELPAEWSPQQNIAWKTALVGHGQSSPVVWDSQVFATTVDGPNKERQLVHCLNRNTGEHLWTQETANSTPVKNTFYVSRAAPTPVVDAKGIFAFFESGDCVRLNHSGEVQWQRNLAKDFGPFAAEFGLGASPCQSENAVFVLLEHSGPGNLVALDKATGETLWKTARPAGNSWSSPATFHIDGSVQVVVSSNGSVRGYDSLDGKALWDLEGLQGNTNVTPIDLSQGQFLTGASPGRQQQGEDLSKKSNGLVQISRSAEDASQWTAKLVWFNEKLSPSWGSPIAKDGLGYWVNRVGVLSCVDLATGDLKYTHRLKQSCWATPYASKDKIYFFGKEGVCTVIKPGETLEVLSENETFTLDSLPPETTVPEEESSEDRRRASANFSGPTLYGIAVAGDQIFARIGNQVIAIAR